MKNYPFSKLFFIAACLSAPALARGGDLIGELIKQGSAFDQKFQPKEALTYYLPAEKLEPKNVELLLCIARQYRHLMADASGQSEKIKLGEIGKEYARRAATLAPSESEAHLSVAISYAKMTPLLDKKGQMEASREIKTEVDKALTLDPSKDLAWHILGCWRQRMASIGLVTRTMARLVYGKLPDATNDEAVKCFQEAIKLNPGRLIHHIELGRTYAQMGKVEEARKCIEKGLAMPNIGKDDPEVKRRGRETLLSLK